MRTFPALEVSWSDGITEHRVDHLVAMIDDSAPLAVEDHGPGVRIFFSDEAQRDSAAEIAGALFPDATLTSLLVPDDNWAERAVHNGNRMAESERLLRGLLRAQERDPAGAD